MYDLVVLGGGPGGYAAAIEAAKKGLKVLLIEKSALGGTCLNSGCIPTKCFYNDSKLLKMAKDSDVLKGGRKLIIDAVKMVERKRNVVKKLSSGLEKLLESKEIEIKEGFGQVISAGEVQVVRSNGLTESYKTKKIIIATGSRPAIPPFIEVDGQFVQTTDEALDCEDLPDKILIIGGGVIGIELAGIYLNLGKKVIIVEQLPDILMGEDKDIRQAMLRLLKKNSATVHLGASVEEVSRKNKDVTVVLKKGNGECVNCNVKRVLVATGRVPVLDGINAEMLELEMSGPYIKVDQYLQTNIEGIYAIGDIVGGMMLAHKASEEAAVAVENAFGGKRRFNSNLIPRCMWGLKEIAAIGLSEEQAKKENRKIDVGKYYLIANGAAHCKNNTEGFVKIIGDTETGEILGVHIIGENATEIIGEVVTTMNIESSVEDLAVAVKPHPTISEAVMEAAVAWKSFIGNPA